MVTNLTNTCPYATMCGWCSKWDKECDRKIGAATQITGGTVVAPEININDISGSDSATAISSKSKRCGGCGYSVTYMGSSVERLKCLITGRFHFYDDACDCDTITATN